MAIVAQNFIEFQRNAFILIRMGRGTFEKTFPLLRPQKGSALINAIIAVGLVAALSAVIFSQTQVTDKTSRNPRVKSAMAVMESEVRALASSASSYTCSGSGSTASCQIKPEIFNALKKSISGAVCSKDASGSHGSAGISNSSCGLQVSTVPNYPFYDPATGMFRARINYQGSEMAMAPIDVTFQLPPGTFKSGAFTCPSNQPLFEGYDASGNPTCRSIPSTCYEAMNLSSPGVYIYSLDPNSLRPHCKALSATALTGCPAGNFLNQVSLSTGSITTSCDTRKNAFTIFNYNPGTGTQVAAISQGSGYAVSEPPTPTTPPPPPSGPPPTSPPPPPPPTTLPHGGGGGGGGGGCFIAGTQILLADGTQKPIEQIQIGDQVLSFDEESHQAIAQFVTRLHHHTANDQVLHVFHMSDGSLVIPNDIHPIFVVEQNSYFRTAEIKRMLDAGVKISFLRADGVRVSVESLEIKKSFTAVYNFEVEGLKSVSAEYGAFGSGHNYYANGFLVHNAIYGNALGKVIQIYLTGVPSFGLIEVK